MQITTNRIMSRLLIACCSCLVTLQIGACADEPASNLDPADAVELPEPASEVDNAELAANDTVTPDDDASAFDDAEAMPLPDEPVDDEEDLIDLGAELDLDALIAKAALLEYGLHPRASAAMLSIGLSASRITQTIGSASASAGTHKQDGTVSGHPYSAATDISVRGLSTTQIHNLLEKLGKVGFAVWYRQPGHDGWPSNQVAHIHAVYANCKMKESLRSQVRSWLDGRNGLRSNTTYRFHAFSSTAKSTVRTKFRASASGTTNAGSSCVVGGHYCGGDKVSGDRHTLYRCTGAGAPAVIEHCASGCVIAPPGQDDYCR